MKLFRTISVTIFLLLALCGPDIRAARTRIPDNATVPGELVTDPPTFRCLGFRWLIAGDDNGNATVTVTFRKSGEQTWREALPMLRVNREVTDKGGTPYIAGNLFAGSVLNLDSGVEYEVRFRLTDPDGGNAERTVKARTRSVPAPSLGSRVQVYPDEVIAGHPGAESLAGAARHAKAGDTILIHTGEYRGPLNIYIDGTAEMPITFVGEGSPVIVGPGEAGNVVEASGRAHLQFRGLTLRSAHGGIKANGARDLVVIGCRIEDVNCGIVSYSTDASNWYIADNEITGRVKNWYPRVDSSDTGVSCAGSGHVICYNRISHFWDDISTDNYGAPNPAWANALHPPQVAVDIYGNDISEALDDGIEADAGLYNVRVFENRVMNVHTGISAQPHHGGPLHIFRNVVYNTTNTTLKLHNFPTGLMIYHNTLIGAGQAFSSFPPGWQNATLRNNLFLGSGNYGMETGSPDRRTTLDYNGYMRKPGADLLIKWSADGGKNWSRYPNLADFQKATGYEQHGKEIGFDIFERASAPREGQTYPVSHIDLGLKAGSTAIDAGCRIPTINDNFTGKAPDIGAYEFGTPLVQYGPRVMKP